MTDQQEEQARLHLALNASIANPSRHIRIIAITSRGGGQLHRFTIDEVMPEQEARDLLTDLRDQADEQLQKLWPAPKEGKHRE